MFHIQILIDAVSQARPAICKSKENLVISEYMPKRLQHISLLLKWAFVAASIGLLVYYSEEVKGLLDKEQEYQRLHQDVVELQQLQQQGEEALRDGDVKEGERLLLVTVTLGTSDTAPYLLLADLYTEYRLYEEALEILDSYSGNDAEIEGKADELKELVAALEQSVFVPQE